MYACMFIMCMNQKLVSHCKFVACRGGLYDMLFSRSIQICTYDKNMENIEVICRYVCMLVCIVRWIDR